MSDARARNYGRGPRRPGGVSPILECTSAVDEEQALHEIARRRWASHNRRREAAKAAAQQKKRDSITLPYVSIQHKPMPE